MPTYLTPGVYVEEVPSQTKPIEGVGTSTAAFVGLAPGGPVNRPMRISNWTQFARIYGDPREPENGPFMAGAYLAHAVYGFFQNGGGLCWVVRVGAADGGRRRPGRATGGGRLRRRGAAGGRQGAASTATSRSGQPRSRARPRATTRAADARPATGSWSPREPSSEEFDGLSLKKGRNYIVTKVNAGSQLIQLEETGAHRSRTCARRGHLQAVAATGAGREAGLPASSRATSRAARAWAAWPPSTR